MIKASKKSVSIDPWFSDIEVERKGGKFMSELKGQLLGMILTLAAFGVIAAALVPAFKSSAESVNKQISVNDSGSVTTANFVGFNI